MSDDVRESETGESWVAASEAVESELPDLGGSSLADLLVSRLPAPGPRLTEEIRRPRSRAQTGGNPGRAE